MSDFWEKNKGSITSGLKTAGKYGYQGTKYVAKTGYKAGKKNFNNKNTNKKGKKNKTGENDDEEEEESDEEVGKSGRNHRDTSMQYPPSGATYQGYPPPMQGWQQPPQNGYPMQQQPPQWQQPPQSWQQPPQQQQPQQQQQWQQFQQTQQYQQFQQFQQPQQVQQPQQYQQYQQQYQQPPQQYQQPPQQPQPQQPPQQAYSFSQQPQQSSDQQQPYGYLNQPSSGISSASSSQHQLGAPPLQQPMGQNTVPAYNNLQPSGAPQTHLQYNDPQQISQAANLEAQVHQQNFSGSVYSRPGMASPPLPGRGNSNQSMPSTVDGNLSSLAGSPVLGVTPFDYENAEENRSASKIRLPQVDLTNLPPPPTHRDRGTLEQKKSNTDSKGSLPQNHSQPNPPARAVVNQPITLEVADDDTGQNEPVEKIPTLPDQETKETKYEKVESPAEDIPPPTENLVGISGKFNYDVKVDYAPPPRPHRVLQQPTIPKSATMNNQVKPVSQIERPGAGSAPPPCPKRQTMDPPLNIGENSHEPLSNFQAPPKPFRHPESSTSRETERGIRGAPHADVPILMDNPHGQPPHSRDVSSFPPPPKPLRSTTRVEEPSASIRDVQYDGNTPPPTPRGRLTTTEKNSTSSDMIDSRPSALAKKSAPPPVKSKPKNLSVGGSDDGIRTIKKEHSQQQHTSELGDISNELAKFKLRKTGSSFVQQQVGNDNEISEVEEKRLPPPLIPRKKESLKSLPPVPIKSSSLRSAIDTKNRTPSNEEPNPFEHYLKSAVPFENDRLHR